MSNQAQFNFDAGSGDDKGYIRWVRSRRLAANDLAQKLGLPLGAQVEVWLCGGIRLRGELRLEEEVLFVEEESIRHLRLMVDRIPFAYREMESCVRVD